MRKNNLNIYRRWTVNEDDLLLSLAAQGWSATRIAEFMARTPKAVEFRLGSIIFTVQDASKRHHKSLVRYANIRATLLRRKREKERSSRMSQDRKGS